MLRPAWPLTPFPQTPTQLRWDVLTVAATGPRENEASWTASGLDDTAGQKLCFACARVHQCTLQVA